MTKHYLSVYCRFRDEARWLREWIEYHLLVGVEHFYMMDHLSTDHPQGVLDPYIKRGQVTLLRWEKELPAPGKGDHSKVFVAMGNHVLAKAKQETKWLAVLDSDEFLVSTSKHKLPAVLQQYESFPAVAVNWQMFGTSGVVKIPEDKLLLECLTKRAPRDYPENKHVKVVVQPALTLSLTIHNGHYTAGRLAVNTNKTTVHGAFNTPILADKLRLHHYVVRDQDFMLTEKIARRKKFNHDPSIVFRWEKELSAEQDNIMQQYIPALKKVLIPPPWQAYLRSNPDLTKAGISTKEAANLHWFNWGRYEGR